MTTYRVRHVTRYEYGAPVVSSHNEIHLLPRRLPRQDLEGLELRIAPTPDTVKWHRDYFGNDVVFFALQVPHTQLEIQTASRVVVRPVELPDTARSLPWEDVAALVRRSDHPERLDAVEYIFDSPFVAAGEELVDYARPSFPPRRPLAEAVLDLSHRIHADFRYDPKATDLVTPLLEVLRERHGVCQDYAHVMIGALRSLGLPARYVSGYLRTRSAPEADAPPAGDELVGSEASHAWVSAWCPVLGWIDTDPTNDMVPSDRHVTLGWGRDYDDVSPVKGVTVGGGAHTVEVVVEVRPAD